MSEHLPQILLMIAIAIVFGSALFYFGIARRSPALKLFGVAMAVMPVAGAIFQVLDQNYHWTSVNYHATILYQPVDGARSYTDDATLPIREEDGPQVVEVSPRVFGSGPVPAGPVELHLRIRSPHDDTVLDETRTVPPLPKVLRWQSFRVQFTPKEPGDYRLQITAPVAVGDIEISMHP